MTKKNQNRFWFMFVMNILLFGIGMIVWTVKSAMSVPVHESNNYMLKYQMADMNINEIMELQEKFNQKYQIELQDFTFLDLDAEEQNSNAKRAQSKPIKLSMGEQNFEYRIQEKNGNLVKNAKVTFLLTRPHSRTEDHLEKNLVYKEGKYLTKKLKLSKEGRYTLQLKVDIDGIVGYSEIPAYLKK